MKSSGNTQFETCRTKLISLPLYSRPQIMTQGGHLVFQTAANHNITFQSNSGGYINLDGENFKTIVQIVSTRRNSVMIEMHAYTHA